MKKTYEQGESNMESRDNILTRAYTQYNGNIPAMEKQGTSIATFANAALETEGLPRMTPSETEELKLRTHNSPRVVFSFGTDASALDFTVKNKRNAADVFDQEKKRKKQWAAERKAADAQRRDAKLIPLA